ncbi:hypothetical protein [Actinomadura napierensis]|uniref:Uncharacterized protein n=1 Tax=Actinomadura napierensis TaxID=267854 RepID=A0ABN2YVV6_9ACTN
MNASIAAMWFVVGALCLVGGCLAWLRMFNLLTGRAAHGIPRWLAGIAVLPLTLPGVAGLWLGVGLLAD